MLSFFVTWEALIVLCTDVFRALWLANRLRLGKTSPVLLRVAVDQPSYAQVPSRHAEDLVSLGWGRNAEFPVTPVAQRSI